MRSPMELSKMAHCILLLINLVSLSLLHLAEGRIFCDKVYVDASGRSGNFTRIQSAVDWVSDGNKHWICIYVKAGIYKEKVVVPSGKTFVVLRGQSKRNTLIVYGDHYSSLDTRATFRVYADNFVAKSISFVNSYNYPWRKNGNPRTAAPAAFIWGDKVSFERCGFFGLQDTLWDYQGRHYFKKCSIVGAVDFIFGAGQSIYEACNINVAGRALDPGSRGYITAQGREAPESPSGFIFVGGRVTGTGKTYLGRPWREYARVLFYKTYMTDVVDPEGWAEWGQKSNVLYSEYQCKGPGSDKSQRISWRTEMSDSDVQRLVDKKYINQDNWIENQPLYRPLD